MGSANCGVPASPHLSPLCVLRVPKERLDKTARRSVPRAFQRLGLAEPWFQARKPLSRTHPPGVMHVAVHVCTSELLPPPAVGTDRTGPQPSRILTTPHPWEGACSPLVTDGYLMRRCLRRKESGLEQASSSTSPASSSLALGVALCKLWTIGTDRSSRQYHF